jgi:hypothetical protein
MKTLKIKITFNEPLLGTASADPDLHARFIASKAPDALTREEEIAVIGAEEVEERTMTVFPKLDDGTPFLWDYQLLGFFKETCGALKRVPGTKSSKLASYKKIIDTIIHVSPRRIVLDIPEDEAISDLQRPLRAETRQGERVALAHSEMCPAGTSFECEIMCENDTHMGHVIEWLDHGKWHGMGQWRNSGMGRFTYEVIE